MTIQWLCKVTTVLNKCYLQWYNQSSKLWLLKHPWVHVIKMSMLGHASIFMTATCASTLPTCFPSLHHFLFGCLALYQPCYSALQFTPLSPPANLCCLLSPMLMKWALWRHRMALYNTSGLALHHHYHADLSLCWQSMPSWGSCRPFTEPLNIFTKYWGSYIPWKVWLLLLGKISQIVSAGLRKTIFANIPRKPSVWMFMYRAQPMKTFWVALLGLPVDNVAQCCKMECFPFECFPLC